VHPDAYQICSVGWSMQTDWPIAPPATAAAVRPSSAAAPGAR